MDAPPTKKRKLAEPEDVFDANPQRPAPTLRGDPFTSNIKHLANGVVTTVSSVSAQLKIPFAVGPDMAHALHKEVDIYGTYSVLPRYGNKPWTQGLMNPMGATSYFGVDETRGPETTTKTGRPKPGPVISRDIVGKAVPLDMDLKTATIESRAMKFLALDAPTYKPKASDEKTRFDNDNQAEFLGGLTMGSYVEEITGKRSIGIGKTGSGMRAMTLASKWRMQNSGTTSEAGFGQNLLASFPQLGKGELKKAVADAGWDVLKQRKGKKEPLMGAAALEDEVRKGGADAKHVYAHHQGMSGSVYKAHIEARDAAKRRFDKKFSDFKAGVDPKTLGKKWDSSQGFLSGLDTASNRKQIKEVRENYVAAKLARHDVENYAGPRALAKQEFKKGGHSTIDKSLDPTGYKREKHAFVKNMLTDHGFSTAKLDASRQAKDKFSAKFSEAKAGNAVQGKWWDNKAKAVDFSSLNEDDRKSLKQEYVARKTGKIPR
ncbi:hypothetical protein [Chitinolyticbacter albus]|uniref:hypothetical protein n=1 Tax=Chitinolyticbacter albus TaxID=2961951 RepID=UPI0021096F38|nr:hypothetical protein [Chitinolyticbacter albus]